MLLVGDPHDSGHYHAEDGISAAALVELYRLCPPACHPGFLSGPRRGKVPAAATSTKADDRIAAVLKAVQTHNPSGQCQ